MYFPKLTRCTNLVSTTKDLFCHMCIAGPKHVGTHVAAEQYDGIHKYLQLRVSYRLVYGIRYIYKKVQMTMALKP